VGGQGFHRLLTVGGSVGQLPSAVAGSPVELAAQPVPLARNSAVDSRWRSGLLEVSMARVWPPARSRAWASCR
jgi:hypothetical protein